MTSSLPPLEPIPRDWSINDNANANANSNNDDDNDDAQSDISIPYSSLTESTTNSTSSDFLTPTSSDAHTVAAEGVNLQAINSVLHDHDERIDDALAQWRSLYHDEIERQIAENRNRDRERSNTITNTLSAGNLQLHTSQTSETFAGEGGGARLNGNEQTRRRGEGKRSRSSPSDSSSTSSGASSFIKFVFNINFAIHHFLFVFVLLLAFSVAYLRLPFLSLSPPTTTSASASNVSHDDQDQFPPLTVLTPAPTETASHTTRSSTPTPAYESAPASPSYAGANQKSKPRPSSRYTRHAKPQPNQTFILVESSTGRALTLIDGNLRLVHVPDPDLISLTEQESSGSSSNSVVVQPCIVKGQCNWHWHCVETSGWLGFRNAASGTFLGHDMWQNIIARVYKHQGWEWMTVRPAPEGPEGKGKEGWYLMVTHWEKLYKIEFLEDRGGLVARDTKEVEGTVWEFVRV